MPPVPDPPVDSCHLDAVNSSSVPDSGTTSTSSADTDTEGTIAPGISRDGPPEHRGPTGTRAAPRTPAGTGHQSIRAPIFLLAFASPIHVFKKNRCCNAVLWCRRHAAVVFSGFAPRNFFVSLHFVTSDMPYSHELFTRKANAVPHLH